MGNFDFAKSKYYIFVIFITLIFIACIAQAFNYLPDKNTNTSVDMSVNLPTDDETDVESDSGERMSYKKSGRMENVDEDFDIDIQQTPKNRDNINRQDEASENSYKNYKLDRIEELNEGTEEKASSQASQEDTAESYYNMAISYAKERRYGTALSYAQKSYNMNPTTAGEVLLARLYYKTGDFNKANDRMNNVLRRDFSADK